VGNIVDSLFADYLPRKQQAPVGVADPRQQTMLTNQMLTPVMDKPVTPPNNYSINPPVNPLRSEFTQPTTQPPVVNSRPIYSNNPPIAPDYGFTQPTQPSAPVVNNRPIYSNNPPIAPDYGFTQPTQPSAPVVNNRPIYSNNPPIAPDYGFTQPTQPSAPVSDQTLTPVMPKPTPPTEEAPEFASVGGIGGGVVPTAEEEEETTDSFEEYLSTLTPDDLDNLDLSGVNLDNIDVSSYEEINAALTGGSVAPTDLEGLSQLYQYQVSLLQNVDTLNKVDIDDRPYWYNTGVSGVLGQPSQYSGDEFRAATGLPDSFALYDSGQGLTQENAQRAMSLLSESASPLEAASQYYGIELQAANNPNSNYNNARKYGTSPEKLAEFQSVIEPILQQVIPYLQVTQGLRYDDALEYAYKNDPMIAALYNQYGVDLFRQTDDGSTYFFDPISGTEARTVEVKDSTARDVGLALTLTAAAFILGPVAGKAIASSAGLTTKAAIANTVAATQGALSAAFQGGDVKNILTNALTAGITGPLQTYVSTTLGVSKEVAAAMTQAGLATAQGAGSKEALLSGFLAGVGEYVKGEMPAANQDFEQFGGDVDAVNPKGFVNTATTRAETKAATDAIKTAATQNPAATMGETLVIAQRNNPNIAADVLASAAQQVASGAVTPKGGMLTKDTPAGELEEVTVTGRMANLNGMEVYVASNGLMLNPQTLLPIGRQLVKGKDGVISFIDADDEILNNYGSEFAEGFQKVYGSDRWLKFLDGILAGEEYTVFGNDITYDKLFGDDPSRKVADVTQEETKPTQPEGASLPDKPTAEDVEPQPDLPLEEDMEIPEFEIENLPPDFNAEIPEVVTPPVTPETPVVPRPDAGGGGGSAGGVVVPPPVAPPATPPATPPPAAPEAPTDEVVDVFDDGGLTGDAFDDSTTGGAEGGAAEDVAVAVTDTEEYRDLQEELNTTRANQETLETTVAGLQDEVAAANAAAKQAQEAAAAAEAAGAANADKLRGEAVAAQANAERVQNELDTANEALGSANSTIESLQTELGTTQQERDVAKKEVTELTKTLDTTKADVETKTKEINTLNTTVSTLNKDVDKLNTELKNANNTVKDIQEELNKAKETNATNVKDLEQKLADAKSKATTTKENLDSKTKELETANGTIKTLTSEVDTANSTIKDLNKQLETKQSEIESTKAELGTAKESNVELTKELEKTNTEVATLEGKLSTVKETNTDLTKRLEDSNTKVGELNENLSSAKEDLASLKDEYAEAVVSNKKNVDSLEKKVKSKESEIKGLEKNIKDADSTVKSLEGEISKNKQEITGLEGSLSEALKAVSGLESSLAESEAATKAAIAKGIADAEAAGEAGFGEGFGEGYGEGYGEGEGVGYGKGFGKGMLAGGVSGGGAAVSQPTPFMASIDYDPELLTPFMAQQQRDYLAELLQRLRA
jgi:predicted  nucleic acid-binding Zn-ribbon protein